MTAQTGTRTRAGGAGLVALAATLWGTDALFRTDPARALPAATLVLAEHVILVLLTAAFLPRALRGVRRAGWRVALAVTVIGVGSSAVATVMFTAAFKYGDPVTPVLLQKLQPLLVVGFAWWLLAERPRRAYAPFLLGGLCGAWLIAFPEPADVSVSALRPALLAVGAAALWAAGTVLGRFVSHAVPATELTALRFAGGLVGSVGAVVATSAPVDVRADQWLSIAGLALVPGLAALLLYYRGLQRTPAMVATLCELAFPLTAALVGTVVLGHTLTATQWLGLALTAGVVVALSTRGAQDRTPVRAAPALRRAVATAESG